MDVGPDSARCLKYAQFASHMVRWQFKVIYWTLFIANLLILFFGSFVYIKCVAYPSFTAFVAPF